MTVDIEGTEKAYWYIRAGLDNIDPEWTDKFKAKVFEDMLRDASDMIDGTHAREYEAARKFRQPR